MNHKNFYKKLVFICVLAIPCIGFSQITVSEYHSKVRENRAQQTQLINAYKTYSSLVKSGADASEAKAAYESMAKKYNQNLNDIKELHKITPSLTTTSIAGLGDLNEFPVGNDLNKIESNLITIRENKKEASNTLAEMSLLSMQYTNESTDTKAEELAQKYQLLANKRNEMISKLEQLPTENAGVNVIPKVLAIQTNRGSEEYQISSLMNSLSWHTIGIRALSENRDNAPQIIETPDFYTGEPPRSCLNEYPAAMCGQVNQDSQQSGGSNTTVDVTQGKRKIVITISE